MEWCVVNLKHLVPFDFFRRGGIGSFDVLRKDIDRLFDLSTSHSRSTVFPLIDVEEDDKQLTISAELPGVEERDIKLSLNQGVLTIRGEKKQEKDVKEAGYHLVERSYGFFSRSLGIPFETDPQAVQADFKNGVLYITVPKSAITGKKACEIPIKAS